MIRRGTLTETPMCFRPLQSTRTSVTYRDLKDHSFLGVEKDFIVGEINLHNEKRFEEMWIDTFDLVLGGRRSCGSTKVANRYTIRNKTVKGWVHTTMTGRVSKNDHGDILSTSRGKKLQSTAGRPVDIDAIGITELERVHKEAEVQVDGHIAPLTTDQSNIAFLGEKVAGMKRRYVDLTTAPRFTVLNTKISPKTIESAKESSIGLRNRACQSLTITRSQNMVDIRLCYIKACLCFILCKNLSPCQKWNADCTTYLCIAKGTTDTKFVVYRETGDRKQVRTLLVQ